MYQFYYAENKEERAAHYEKKLSDVFCVTAIRPSVWEEHCLECSAPLCYHSCPHYQPRLDGRCKRFENGYHISDHPLGCCGQSVRIKFRKWANMMTIIFPGMLDIPAMSHLVGQNQKLGIRLERIAKSSIPAKIKWEMIRTAEYLRRRKLRKAEENEKGPDAFVFHGYSFEASPFNLIVEIYDGHTPVFKRAILLQPGENLAVIDKSQWNDSCCTVNHLVKIYPENDIEAELDILWCDFVQGRANEPAVTSPTIKCVVWDLDQTLWDGILIETDRTNDLHLRPGVLETIRALDERGILQSVASKNDYAAAWPVLERLQLTEYFLYPQIHWNAKSASVAEIAKQLNIGIDTFALIDDSPYERAQVQSEYPQVRVYDPSDLPELLDRPEFQTVVTDESRQRRAMYRAEEKRKTVQQADGGDIVSFLKKSHLQIELFEPRTEEEIRRCYELVMRTNQLNMSGKKYTRDEFNTVLSRPMHRNFAFSCQDDFGKYGIVGFGQYRQEGSQLIFTEFAMSCRVAKKYVESALFSALLKQNNAETGVFTVQKTQKNALLRSTLDEIGFYATIDNSTEINYHFTENLSNKKVLTVSSR